LPATVSGIVVDIGTSTTCTFSNVANPGTLIVKKVVVNSNGGTNKGTDFSFQVGSGNPINFQDPVQFLQDPDQNPLHGQNKLTKGAGTYTITEPSVAGYDTTYQNCSGVALANGGDQTCTITNTAQQAYVIVKKVVNKTHGGTASPDDFK